MIKYKIEKFPIGAVAKCLARTGGNYIFSLTADEDLPNGVFVGKGDFVELDHYKAAAAGTVSGKIVAKAANGNYYVEVTACDQGTLFVSNVALIEEDWTKEFQKEENYFNPAGTELRCYAIEPGAILELNKAALGLEGEPSKNQVVTTTTYGDSSIAKVLN